MTKLTIRLGGDEPTTVYDMGEGYFISSQTGDNGKATLQTWTLDSLLAFAEAAAQRYAERKTLIAI